MRLSRASESRTRTSHIEMSETGERVAVEVDNFHSHSEVVATNLGAVEEATRSRMLRLLMMPLSGSGKRFGEAIVASDESENVRGPHKEADQRALQFFMRCVAGFCMLVNAGVVTLPPNAVNVTLINYLLPNTTDENRAKNRRVELKRSDCKA